MTNIHIPDLFKGIAAKVDEAMFARAENPFHVYFDYGHYVEVSKNLTSKDLSVSQKNKKYPLIWLVMDFEENFNGLEDAFCELPALQVFIAVPSEADLSTEARMQKNFFPFLYPIYQSFLEQIALSGYFDVVDPADIIHRRILRPYWGGQDSNGNGTANLFNDMIDAIQIRNLNLKVNTAICDQFTFLSHS